MIGLVLKDMLLLKSKAKKIYFPVFLLAYVLGIFFFKEIGTIIINIITIFFSISLALPLFTEDAKDEWIYFSKTLPINMKDIVLSRYLSMFLILIAVSFLNLIIDIFVILVFSEGSFGVYISTIGLSILISLLYMSLLIPSVYLAGINGSSIVFLILIGIFALIQKTTKTSFFMSIVSISPYKMFLLALIIVFAILVISYLISCMILKKK
ncbi:ABC-2 transporter permease [Enterococcus faecalis]|uniref:ABC-2 transporter permease n=1 Tax=Enterococcus faecalis TaxID=1351 RepID=UPI00094E719C|nr:ABC-2 transporter permease [Enterococcus faecalis]EGO2680158.1 ABC-2 transporter permease [Enterococcus faecalis]EGO7951090.1 ABC-2 transporter permease [Enterococcus faecalis]EGO8126382.1 ABC-2 transporter permease [Enterococcus faecalis]EGO8292716.1 ABC-2 transporter permease [Enterococcus faecalis]EGO8495090.1 ABC-2 transporter permease [Enterococcus faecalis]